MCASLSIRRWALRAQCSASRTTLELVIRQPLVLSQQIRESSSVQFCTQRDLVAYLSHKTNNWYFVQATLNALARQAAYDLASEGFIIIPLCPGYVHFTKGRQSPEGHHDRLKARMPLAPRAPFAKAGLVSSTHWTYVSIRVLAGVKRPNILGPRIFPNICLLVLWRQKR